MRFLIASVMFAVLVTVGQAAPITTPTTSTHKIIYRLEAEAQHEVYSIYQDIRSLEANYVRYSTNVFIHFNFLNAFTYIAPIAV